MLRTLRPGFGLLVLLALTAADARAQYYGGYGGYGWGGWGGASTVQGSIARGLGYYEQGEGILNLDDARAAAIDENTVANWNQYLYLSQQEANRREHLRMARREQRDARSGDLVAQRLKDNPTEDDINNGSALNFILTQLTDPRIHSSSLRLATTPLDAAVIKTIPFENASEAVTISLDQLTAAGQWPLALQGDAFAAEQRAYKDVVAQALKEDENGSISPATLQAVTDAVGRLHAKLEANPPADRIQAADARNYIKGLYGMSRMLQNPRTEKVLAQLEKTPRTSLGGLLGFMHTYNLRFGPSTTDEQRAVYQNLYPAMAAHRDRVLKDAGVPAAVPASTNPNVAAGNNPPPTANANAPAVTNPPPANNAVAAGNNPRPTDFFRGMRLEHLRGDKALDAPVPAPVPAPAPPNPQ